MSNINEKILVAGFGGQGVLAIGKMLAEAAMAEGAEVSWLPSYGPEMRGGTSNVSVNLSDSPIGSPLIAKGDASCIIAMNLPSMIKFESYVKPGGLLLVNSSIIDRKCDRTDINVRYVPVNDIANEMGNPRVANMVMLGAYLEMAKVVKVDTLIEQLKDVFGKKNPKLVDLNKDAIERGAKAAREQ